MLFIMQANIGAKKKSFICFPAVNVSCIPVTFDSQASLHFGVHFKKPFKVICVMICKFNILFHTSPALHWTLIRGSAPGRELLLPAGTIIKDPHEPLERSLFSIQDIFSTLSDSESVGLSLLPSASWGQQQHLQAESLLFS